MSQIARLLDENMQIPDSTNETGYTSRGESWLVGSSAYS